MLLIAIAGLMVGTAGIGERYLIVVPSQTHGRLLPYLKGSYTPSWVEISVVVGLMALEALALVLFFKVFPVMDVDQSQEGG
jgi:Ni/Fe-hydrogenase subunit HybB-like protein